MNNIRDQNTNINNKNNTNNHKIKSKHNNNFLCSSRASILVKKSQDSKFHEFNDEDKLECKTEKQAIGLLIDQMGFSKYNFFIFVTAGLILFFNGIQEIMLAFQLSMILERKFLNSYHLAFINTIEVLGYTLSTIFVNIIINYLTPKKSIILFCCSMLVFTGLTLLSFNYFFTLFIRLCIGFSIGMLDVLVFLNLIENMPTKIRGFISSFVQVFYPFGQLIFSFFSCKFVSEGNMDDNYKYLLLSPFIFLIFILIFIIYLNESPRYLIADDNLEDGIKAIEDISIFNKQQIEIIQQENKGHEKENNYKLNHDSSHQNLNIPIKNIDVNLINNQNELISKQASESVNKHRNDIALDLNVLNNQHNNSNYINPKNMNLINNNINNNPYNQEEKRKEDFKCRENQINKSLSEDDISNVSNYHKKHLSIFEKLKIIFKPKYRKITTNLWICSFCTGFIFNGIFFMLPTTAPKLDPFHLKQVILSVAMELPSIFLASILIESKKIGRLYTIKIAYVCTFLVCLVPVILQQIQEDLIINCSLKFCITIPSNILIVYTSEIYNSRVRTIGRSLSDFWKRIANIIAPFAISYLEINYGMVYIFYAFILMAIIQIISSTYLVIESAGKRLDEIIKHE